MLHKSNTPTNSALPTMFPKKDMMCESNMWRLVITPLHRVMQKINRCGWLNVSSQFEGCGLWHVPVTTIRKAIRSQEP